MIPALFFAFSLTRHLTDSIICLSSDGRCKMSSIPYSRYLIGAVPWYSFLIVTGVLSAIVLACREERRAGLPKDTVIDLALRLLPAGIIGARIYYVLFSWDQFRDDLLSVFRIWEGGIAIYGGIIGGLIVLILFCRKRQLSVMLLCDLIVPGLALAQGIGRWGNWFNIEAYGMPVTQPELCFFPFAVQVPADGFTWHLATFFFESAWDILIFVFLMIARRRFLRMQGDAFRFYLLLYASGRLVIEELRMDSLFAASSVRISQLLSILLCIMVILVYLNRLRKAGGVPYALSFFVMPVFSVLSVSVLLYALTGSFTASLPASNPVPVLCVYAVLAIAVLLCLYFFLIRREVYHADDKA